MWQGARIGGLEVYDEAEYVCVVKCMYACARTQVKIRERLIGKNAVIAGLHQDASLTP